MYITRIIREGYATGLLAQRIFDSAISYNLLNSYSKCIHNHYTTYTMSTYSRYKDS